MDVDAGRKSELQASDLLVDAVYQGGRNGNASDDPLPHLVRSATRAASGRSVNRGFTLCFVQATYESLVDIRLIGGVHLEPRRGIVAEEKERNCKVLLLRENGHLPERLVEPDAGRQRR